MTWPRVWMGLGLGLGLAMIGAGAEAARPVESVEAERETSAAALRDLDRRAASLKEQLGLRERLLRRRLRALYKLTQGGTARLFIEARDVDDLSARLGVARRVIARDLGELAALGDELRDLDGDKVHRAEELTRAARIATGEARDVDGDPPRPSGLLRRRGQLERPVPGAIAIGLANARVRDPRGGAPSLELPRRAVELHASRGEPVRAIAAGRVRWVGELEGLGKVVLIDHGDRYVSVSGRLGRVSVREGSEVGEGALLGCAAGDAVAFALSEGRMPLDPARWLRPPPPPPASSAPSPAPSAPSPRAATLAE